MRSPKRREGGRTQSHSEGRCAPCLHRPRAGGRLEDQQASSQKQGRLSPRPRVSRAVTKHTCLREDQHHKAEKGKGMGLGHRGELLSRRSRGLFKVPETAADLPGDGRVTERGDRGDFRGAPADSVPSSMPLSARDPGQAPNSPTRPRPRCGCPSTTRHLRTETEQGLRRVPRQIPPNQGRSLGHLAGVTRTHTLGPCPTVSREKLLSSCNLVST